MGADHAEAAAYWQRLRKDVLSNTATLSITVAVIATTLILLDLTFDGARGSHRGSPIYWALLILPAIWIVSLGGFSRWATRLLRPAVLVLPILACVACLLDLRTRTPVYLPLAAAGAAILGSLVCHITFPRSLLFREGPDRRR